MALHPRTLLAGLAACLLVAVAGCSGFAATETPSAVPSPMGPSTATPTATPTTTPETETLAPGGLLIVDIVENRSTVNESEVVAYTETIVGETPTLDDAIAAAISTNSTQTRDLSSEAVRRVESVADAYDRPTGEFVVSKNGTVVRVSLAYEA